MSNGNRTEAPPMQDEIAQFETWCTDNGFELDQHGANSILFYVHQCLTNYAELMMAHESDRQKYRGIIEQKDRELSDAVTIAASEVAARASAEDALQAERRKPPAE